MNTIQFSAVRYAEMYIQLNLVMAAMIIFIYSRSKKNPLQTIYSKYFDRANLHLVTLIVCDAIWKLIDLKLLPNNYCIAYVVNVLYFISMYMYIFYCFVYFEFMIDRKVVYSTRYRTLLKLPTYVMCILAMISPFSRKLFFYIDDNLSYVRGPLYFLMYVVYTYWGLCGIFAFLKLKDYKNRKTIIPKTYYWIIAFPILPMLFGYLGVINDSFIPTFQIGATLNLIMYYIAMLEKVVSYDELSDLATTHSVIKYINDCTKSNNIKNIYLVMFKINNLREVSKDVGITEAQNVIIHCGDVFKFICNYPEYKGCFPGKISDNIFAVVVPNTDIEDIGIFTVTAINDIKEIEKTINYKLEISTWYNKYNKYIDIRDFITYSRENIT